VSARLHYRSAVDWPIGPTMRIQAPVRQDLCGERVKASLIGPHFLTSITMRINQQCYHFTPGQKKQIAISCGTGRGSLPELVEYHRADVELERRTDPATTGRSTKRCLQNWHRSPNSWPVLVSGKLTSSAGNSRDGLSAKRSCTTIWHG